MKQTIVDQIEITALGVVNVRMLKQIIDGEVKHDMGFHRVSLEPGADTVAAVQAVNGHLAVMGFAGVTGDDWQRVERHAAVEWTPEVLSAWDSMLAAQVKALHEQLQSAVEAQSDAVGQKKK